MNSFLKRYLDPSERMSELLFGLIMTLTFTLGANLVIREGPDATRELLAGVLGCNIAWGIIDGLLYVFNAMYARGGANRAARLHRLHGRAAMETSIRGYVNDTFGNAIKRPTEDSIVKDLAEFVGSSTPPPVRLKREDVLGAIASFVLVAATSIPAIAPFLFIPDRLTALRVSNLLMIVLIYHIGCQWAAHIDANRRKVGLSVAAGCLLIVQLTILLGG